LLFYSKVVKKNYSFIVSLRFNYRPNSSALEQTKGFSVVTEDAA